MAIAQTAPVGLNALRRPIALTGNIGFSIGSMDEFMSMPDEALLARSLSNPSAFEVLVARYQSQFLSRVQGIVGSRDAAEDVVQEAFIRVYRFAPRFKGESGSFRAWSLTILMNVARTHYRKIARGRESFAELTSEHYESLADPSIHAKEGHQEYAREVIEKGLSKVPEHVAEILKLAFIEGLPYAEIAEKLGTSVPAIKTRVHRAKAVLRESMGSVE
ncbi:MAG: RNA polymerase sigma-70 factor, ECF subfamily [Parcubacteria group bacterium Greene0714_7]|nr:MAG: RNA polymerase sigma-70 factor, ECF subfamily [Parcubacteria group bacterium Greene0714_7]